MKYLISISYDGSKFQGFQRLKKGKSVQKTIEDALSIIGNEKVQIKGAGRTDARVHAYQQKASFCLNVNISSSSLQKALNNLIKPYIYITDVSLVDNSFHARYNCQKKVYTYRINMGKYNPLEYDYSFFPNYELNINLMQECSKIFIGKHNFRNFIAGTRKNYETTINDITFKLNNNILEISFTGQCFYRYMVRKLVGALIDVGRGKVQIEDVLFALKNPDIKSEFMTAIPNGLYLTQIYY